MVKEIKAFQATDGSIHDTYEAAAKQDFDTKLANLAGSNSVIVNFVREHSKALYEALDQLYSPKAAAADRRER